MSGWRKFAGYIRFEVKKVERLKLKRAFRKEDGDPIPEGIQSELVYNICGKLALSHAVYVSVLRDRRAGYLCQFCDKISRSDAGLKQHMRVYEEKVDFKTLQNKYWFVL